MDELIALRPEDFENPELIPSALEAIQQIVVALADVVSFTEIAKILRGVADVLDQQAARNERGRNN